MYPPLIEEELKQSAAPGNNLVIIKTTKQKNRNDTNFCGHTLSA